LSFGTWDGKEEDFLADLAHFAHKVFQRPVIGDGIPEEFSLLIGEGDSVYSDNYN